MNEKLKHFINHPAINHSWLAEKIVGSRSVTARANISRKINGVRKWKAEDLTIIETLYNEFKQLFIKNKEKKG
jgi:hypothetical protein